jgi:hypothetical protein
LSTLEFVSSIIKSISWPTVVLTITILLRKPITKILSNLNRFKYNNLEMDFAQKLEEMEANLETKEIPNNYPQSSNIKRDKEIITVARISPAASITMAWSMVEQEIMSTIKRLSISPDYPLYNSPLKNINLLKDAGLIDFETEKTLNELRSIRNKAVHGHISDANITYLEAIQYYELSIKVTKLLKNLNREN